MLNDILKSIAVRTYRLFIIDGIEHIFIDTNQGALIHIMPHLKKSRVVNHLVDFASENRYYATYSHTSKAFYFIIKGNELIEYYPLTGEKNIYNVYNKGGFPLTAPLAQYSRNEFIGYQMRMATDGNIYIGQVLYRGLYGYVRFNVVTKEFDDSACIPDREYTHIHGRNNIFAFVIDNNAAFEGLYSSYLFTDDYTHLRPTVFAEIVASGIAFSNSVEFYLHWGDRDIASVKRRIYTRIGVSDTWKVIDVKSPSTWIDTQSTTPNQGNILAAPATFTCVDQVGNVVDKTGWGSREFLPVYAATFGIQMPTFDSNYCYSNPYQIGRYVYIGENRLGSNLHHTFAIHPTTKEAIYPNSFNKWNTHINNGAPAVYKCNFNGDFGFSYEDELVVFMRTTGTGGGIGGNWGFIRPDTHTFYAYDPITDNDGYIIRAVDMYNINDPDGFGVRWGGSVFSGMTETLINGENCFVDAFGKSAIAEEFVQDVLSNTATVTFNVYPQKNRPAVKFGFDIDNLVIQTANLSQAINVRDNILVCVGRIYTGAVVITQDSPTEFTLNKYISSTGSPNGMWRIDNNRVFIGAYIGKQTIIDTTTPNASTRVSLIGGDVSEAMFATVRPDGLLFTGIVVRGAGYQGGFIVTHVDLNNYAVTGISNRFPTEFNGVSSTVYRQLVGLSDSDYSDAAVEDAVQARMTAASLTRAQVIAEFVDSCRWSNSDMHSWGNYTVFGLKYVGRRKLANIRIEQTVGSGVWIDQNYQPATYNKVLLVNSTDIKNLQPSEIKIVEMQIGVSNYLGRVAGTDNYLAWVNHKIADGQGVVQIISKSNFIAAANGSGVITSFDNIATIEFGSTSLSSVGFGDSNNFDSSPTQQINCIASKGDYLYITMRSLTGSSPYPAIMRVNCADGTQTVFARTATNAIRTISINANKMVITTGSSVQTVDNFESATLPITI